MSKPAVAPYWKAIGFGSAVGVVMFIGVLNLYYLIFATDYSLRSFADAARWGLSLGLVTSAFVIVGTLALMRSLHTGLGKGLFVLLSFLSPIIGWVLVGIVTGLVATWMFFVGYPVIGAVAGVGAGMIAAVATFFLPSSEPEPDRANQVDQLPW